MSDGDPPVGGWLQVPQNVQDVLWVLSAVFVPPHRETPQRRNYKKWWLWLRAESSWEISRSGRTLANHWVLWVFHLDLYFDFSHDGRGAGPEPNMCIPKSQEADQLHKLH
jgi:hypothetical protein